MRFYRKNNVHIQAQRQVGQGDLSVVVTTASGAIALLEASVSVSKDGVLLYHTLTGDDAMTPVLTVALPEMELSTLGEAPSVLLEVRVYMQGYRTVVRKVKVYADRQTYLQVDMQPLCDTSCLRAEGGNALGG